MVSITNLVGNTVTALKTTASQTTVYPDGTTTTVTNTIGQTVGNPEGGRWFNFNTTVKDGKVDGENVSIGVLPLNVGVNKDAQLTVGGSLPGSSIEGHVNVPLVFAGLFMTGYGAGASGPNASGQTSTTEFNTTPGKGKVFLS